MTPPQAEVLSHALLDSGFNCVLQMPTGSGKTWLARRAIANTVEAGYRAIYLCPTRALAAELYAAWQQEYGANRVGIFTGDYGTARRPYPVDFADAHVLLMTPERFDACTRHWRSHWNWLPEVDLLVADEFHLLGDGLRGARLEGALGRLRRLNPFARIVGLSATLGNRAELADWLEGVEYESTWRPVELEWRQVRFKKASDKPELLSREVTRIVRKGGRSLVFTQSRRRAESLAVALASSGLRAAHHHAGLRQEARADVEEQFRNGLLDVLVATATLEVGLNLPARQVVLYDVQEFDGTDYRPLRTISVWQRAGRAGRYGIDTHGEVVLIGPSWEKSFDRYQRGDFEPVRSQLTERTNLAEQVLVELHSGLARNRSELRSVFSRTLAACQLPCFDVSACIEEMIEADMLSEAARAADDEREVRLKPTRKGRIAVRHMLEPRSVATLSRLIDRVDDPTFLDLALMATLTRDCEPVLPCDFEELETLTQMLRASRSYLLANHASDLSSIAEVSHRRTLASLKMAAVVMEWVRLGDAEAVAGSMNCYSFEVNRLTESVTRLITALSDLLRPASSPDGMASDNDPLLRVRRRVDLLITMVSEGLDRDSASLTMIRGLGPVWARRLREHGIRDVEELAQADLASLGRIKGLSQKRAAEWIDKAEVVIKQDDLWETLDFGPKPSVGLPQGNWPAGVDPYRFKRALQLTVGAEHDAYRVTGGLDPHVVKSHRGRLECDCADHKRGHICKHILAVRLAQADASLQPARNWFERYSDPATFSLTSLWFAEEPRHEYRSPLSLHQDTQRRHRVSGVRSRHDVREEIPA